MFEIGLQLRYSVIYKIYMDYVYNIGRDTINSTLTQNDDYDNNIAIEDFLINSLPILILGLLISILSIFLEFVNRYLSLP